MPDEGDEIERYAVVVEPDLNNFRKKLLADLKKATAGVSVTAKVKLVADRTGFQASARRALAGFAKPVEYKVRLVADASGFQRSVNRAIKARYPDGVEVRAKLVVGGTSGGGGTGAATGARQLFKEVDKSSLVLADTINRRLKNALNDAFVLPNDAQAINDRNRAYNQLASAQETHLRAERRRYGTHQEYMDHLHRVALTEQARREKIAHAESERLSRRTQTRQSSTLASSLLTRDYGPKIIDFGGKGIKPMNALYATVAALSPALIAMGSSAVQASTAVAALGSAGLGAVAGLGALVGGLTNVFSALSQADNTRLAALKDATKATAGADAAQRTRSIALAERSLADAQERARDAQKALNAARAEAKQDLIDLRELVSDLAREEDDAALSLAEAREKQREVNANFWASDLERARAALDVREAEDKLSDTQKERAKRTKELTKSERDGINGAEKVVNARKDLRDANRDVVQAQQDLAHAHRDVTTATVAASAASTKLDDLLARMHPNAIKLFRYLNGPARKALWAFQRRMEGAITPGFLQFLKDVGAGGREGSALDVVADSAERLGKSMSDTARSAGKIAKSGWFRSELADILASSEKSLSKLSEAALTLVRPFMRIFRDSSPLMERFSEYVLRLSQRFDAFIENASKTGALRQWFKDAGDELANWWGIATDLLSFLRDVMTASLPTGQNLVSRVRDLTDQLQRWSGSAEGQKQIKEFFDMWKNFNYREAGEFIADLIALTVAFKTVRLAANHPILALMAVLAAMDPKAAAQAVDLMANAFIRLFRWVEENKNVVAALLAFVVAVKGLKTLQGLKIGGKGGLLGGALGGPKTAVMNVQAGVVNIMGGAGLGGVPGGKPGAKPGGKWANIGKGAAAALGLEAVTTGAGVMLLPAAVVGAAALWGKGKSDEINARNAAINAENAAKKAADTSALAKLRPATAQSKTDAAKALRGDPRTGLPSAVNIQRAMASKSEADTARSLNQYYASYGKQISKNTVMQRQYKEMLDKWVASRRNHIEVEADYIRQTQGEAEAQAFIDRENRKTVDSLGQLIERTGVSARKADEYTAKNWGVARSLTGITTEANKIPANRDLAINLPGGKAAEDRLKVINKEIRGLVGTKEATVKITPTSDANKQLEKLVVEQSALRNGWTIGWAKKKYDQQAKYATGGPVFGAGTATSDSIPAWLSNGEHVWTAREVQAAGGHQAIERMRQSVRGYATGGKVDRWPFLVTLPDTLFAPGIATGEYTGKVPKGLGSVKGLGAAIMAAAIDAKQKFPYFHVTSGLRKTYTSSGNKSNHWFGRAIDIAPHSMAMFNYLADRYPNARELIYAPAANRNIWRGRKHRYSGDVLANHWDHIHLALAKGGRVRKYDSGGVLPPGLTLAVNNTGKNEQILTNEQAGAAFGRMDRRDMALLAQYIAVATARPITMDGRKVAEQVNAYAYLPGTIS